MIHADFVLHVVDSISLSYAAPEQIVGCSCLGIGWQLESD